MGVRLADAAKSMNSWTCFRHGDGGEPLVNLNKKIKDFPDVPREVIDVLVERAVVDGKEAHLPVLERHELREVRRADLVQVVDDTLPTIPIVRTIVCISAIREPRFGGQDHEEDVGLGWRP